MSNRNSEKDRKKIAIVQSNYIPWKGYFDLIRQVDTFVLYDEVQYTRRDWRNRNKIKTQNGLQWLTIPVIVKGRYSQRIEEVRIADEKWFISHWDKLHHAYSKAPFYDKYSPIIKEMYYKATFDRLSNINRHFIEAICEILNIPNHIVTSPNIKMVGDKSERLLHICNHFNASTYLSGPTAREYLDENMFMRAGIDVEWMNYDKYAEYPQLYGKFEHNVTVLDLIFNVGADSLNYM